MKRRHEIYWIDLGILPGHVGFCPSRKAWRREMKRMGVKGEKYPETDGRCTSFSKAGKLVILVTITDDAQERASAAQIIGMLAHEAMHAWRFVRLDIGEHEPSAEFEAYAMQAITQGLVTAFSERRGLKLG